MARLLQTSLLDNVAKRYASHWLMEDSRKSEKTLQPGKIPVPGLVNVGKKAWVSGPEMVKQDLFNLTYKDEFEYVTQRMKDFLADKENAKFEKFLKGLVPRDDKNLAYLLREHLAVDINGDHIEGAIGKVEVGVRLLAKRPFEVETLASLMRRAATGLPFHDPSRTDRETEWVMRHDSWPIYAGEGEERAAGRIRSEIGKGPGADPLPPDALPLPVGANVTNISAEACIAALDAVRLRLDEGTTAANIRGRTGAQPADPDAAETGTLLFTLVCSDPAVNAAVDDTDGSCSATFASITDDTSADAGGTLTYCRFAATGTGADDHIDGNATTDATGATDWNTVTISAGSTISMTSAVIGQSQGSTAT